jgi:dihydropteroate synthase
VVPIGGRTRIMGVLNVTPDSFSDGGAYRSRNDAVARALQMVEEGADMIDVGGESTRPGAEAVTVEEEIARTIPLLEVLREKTDVALSIDTTKSEVASRALAAGADIVNDVSALTFDPDMIGVVASTGAGVVLMHMRGDPRTMQVNPAYDQVVSEVAAYVRERVAACVAAGIEPDRLAVDPGIGFGKTVDHNLALLRGLPVLAALGRPLLIGLSRKSFLGALTGRGVDDRLAAGLGAQAFAVMSGAHLLRVHDVKETCDAVRIVDILRDRQ